MLNLNSLRERLDELVEEIYESTTPHNPRDAGLDPRCRELLLGEDFIATENPRDLEYHGGFEYIESEYVLNVGTLRLYSIESDRVADAMGNIEFNCG